MIDRNRLAGSINFVGSPEARLSPDEGKALLAKRSQTIELHSDPELPADTRLWALLQQASGGTWGGCVYDVDAIERRLRGASC